MGIYVEATQKILDRFEVKKKEAGFTYAPPADKAVFGEYAFADDVLNVIIVGVIIGVFQDLIVWLFQDGFQKWYAERTRPADSIDRICEDIFASTKAIEEGIELLKKQGVQAGDAATAVELLKAAIVEELREAGVSAVKPRPADGDNS